MTWALKESALKAYLGITGTSEDTNLELWLAVMAEAADYYIEAEFATLPKTVEMGVYLGVGILRGRRDTDGIAEIETKDLRQRYFEKAAFATDAAFRASRDMWRFTKNDRSLDGK
jgi:hypothetical protein